MLIIVCTDTLEIGSSKYSVDDINTHTNIINTSPCDQ